jgi:alpha/beta superfamily hydrolase
MMDSFAQRKAAADATRDNNVGDLIGCLAWQPPANEPPEIIDVSAPVALRGKAAAHARAAVEAQASLETAERDRAWGHGPSDEAVALRRQHSTAARARAKAALVPRPAVAERRVTVKGADGDDLHCIVTGYNAPTALVLIPALGGTSDMAELCGIARRAASENIASIRYDQRGTGRSGGSASLLEPDGEVRDCGAVVQWARELLGATRVYVCGVSFGATVAAAAAGRFATVAGFACISYPTDYLWFLTLPHAASRWRTYADVRKPKLFVWGTQDQYAAKDGASAWYGTLAPPKAVVLFEGLDPKRGHVFHTPPLVAALSERVVGWVLEVG